MSQFKDGLLGSNLPLEILVMISCLTEDDIREIRRIVKEAMEAGDVLGKAASYSDEALAIAIRDIDFERKKRLAMAFDKNANEELEKILSRSSRRKRDEDSSFSLAGSELRLPLEKDIHKLFPDL